MFGYGRLFLYGTEKTYIFKHFNSMWNWLVKRNRTKNGTVRTVNLYTNVFNYVYKYYKEEKPIKIGGKVIGVKVYGLFSVYDAAFKVGSNDFTAKELLDMIPIKTRYNSGFNGELRKRIHMDRIKEEFPPIPKRLRQIMLKEEIRCGPIIYCRPGEEFENPSAYDITSAYPYWLVTAKFPYRYLKVEKRKKSGLHYCRVEIKGLKAKNWNYNPLFKKEENNGELISNGTRILAAENYNGYVYYELFLPVLKRNYDYESIEIDENEIYLCEMKKLPDESIAAIKELYDKKSETKQHKDKIRLNRVFGLFITRTSETGDAADYEVPYQVGKFVMNLQGFYMDNMIHRCGIEHLVRAHTDSIIFDYDVSHIVYEENNRRHSYKALGMWAPEQYQKWTAYSNTRAKYIDGQGRTGIKHGGITKEEVNKFLEKNNYETITASTPIKLIRERTIIDCNGGVFIKQKLITSPFG